VIVSLSPIPACVTLWSSTLSHKAEDVITDGMVSPGSMAIDRENRLLYVSDIELDQVLVYDADSLKLLRKIGTTGSPS
jgi:sugar lactone lactonase YvrE